MSCLHLVDTDKRNPVERVHHNHSAVHPSSCASVKGMTPCPSRVTTSLSAEHCCCSSDLVFSWVTVIRSLILFLYHQELLLRSRLSNSLVGLNLHQFCAALKLRSPQTADASSGNLSGRKELHIHAFISKAHIILHSLFMSPGDYIQKLGL